jgi:hypothetical protein
MPTSVVSGHFFIWFVLIGYSSGNYVVRIFFIVLSTKKMLLLSSPLLAAVVPTLDNHYSDIEQI